MSESTSASSVNGNGPVPSWMKSVDQETLYNADPPDATDEEAADEGVSPVSSPPDDHPDQSATPDGSSPLSQKLALSMADPSDIPAPDPDLQPTPVGHVRSDLNRQLEKAVSVLASRYATDFSRSLVLEFSLQRTLLALRKQGEESGLVKWLDSMLPRD